MNKRRAQCYIALNTYLSQRSKGEYADANNTEDDIALIAEQLSLNQDDHGDDLNSATPLVIDSDGQILISNTETDPHDLYPENKGVIDSAADQDLFYFSATAGEVDLSVNPAWDAFYRTSNRGANLDILVSLLDASGTTLATSDPALDTYAGISVNVPGGTYYLSVSGVGSSNYSDYSSTGQYFIGGHVSSGEIPNTPPVADYEFDCLDLDCSFTDSSIDGDGSIVAWAWTFGDGTTTTVQNPSHTYTSDGAYSVGLTVTDNVGASATATQGIVVASSDDNEPPVVTITSPVDGADVSDSVVLSAFATDNQEVLQINIYTDGSLLCSGTYSASCTWNLRKVASGTHTVSSDARDAAGNVGSTSVSVDVLDGGSRGNSGRVTSHLISLSGPNPPVGSLETTSGPTSTYPLQTNEDLLALECDILVPAAIGNQIHAGNVKGVRAALVVEGANGPLTATADLQLAARGIPAGPGKRSSLAIIQQFRERRLGLLKPVVVSTVMCRIRLRSLNLDPAVALCACAQLPDLG